MKPYLTALVIDDSAYNRRTLSRLLEDTGFVQVVATASDGEEGLRRALALGPDLVTVDLEMPRMDGFTFLRILMAQRPTPVIVISGQADDQNVFRALDFGAVDFLAKPTRYISDRLLDIKDELAAKVGAVRELQVENLRKRAAVSAGSVPPEARNRPGPEGLGVSDRSAPGAGSVPPEARNRPGPGGPGVSDRSVPGDGSVPRGARNRPGSEGPGVSDRSAVGDAPRSVAVGDARRPAGGENRRGAAEAGRVPPDGESPTSVRSALQVVVVGASTGGPTAIQAVLTRLGDRFPLPIVVAQHMPGGFTRTFAERLDRLSPLEVREARDGDPLAPGRVLIAPGGCNTLLARTPQGLTVRTESRTAAQSYVPSVDMLFESAAAVAGLGTLGVLLTGMGSDGRRGMTRIRAAGGQTIAESEETAIIFGMPREAIAAGAVELVAPLPAIPAEILRRVGAEIA